MKTATYRVFAQNSNGGSLVQCCLSYEEAHELAENYRAGGFENVRILADKPSLDHVRLRSEISEPQ